MLFRRDAAKIKDVWQVMGLRGTGSDDYSVQDLLVDDAHTLTRDAEDERREPGLLYRFAAMQLYASGFACVGLGTARAMLDSFISLARAKTPALSSTPLRDNNTVQHIIGYSDARLKAAKAGLLRILEQVQQEVGQTGRLSLDNRMAIRQASTYAIHAARDVVHAVYHEAGASAIFENQPFERRFRDMNAVSQQLQGRRSHFEAVGLHLLGGKPSLRWV